MESPPAPLFILEAMSFNHSGLILFVTLCFLSLSDWSTSLFRTMWVQKDEKVNTCRDAMRRGDLRDFS